MNSQEGVVVMKNGWSCGGDGAIESGGGAVNPDS